MPLSCRAARRPCSRGTGRAVFSAVALFCLFAIGLDPVSASAGNGALVLHSCSVSGYSARCGTLMVPEDRFSGVGRKIPLRVVVVPASGPVRQADPIVWFQGGPGGSAVDFAAQQMPLFELDMSRDVVFIEQRGTGASDLSCPGSRASAPRPHCGRASSPACSTSRLTSAFTQRPCSPTMWPRSSWT
jgi:pimeloyl-ACP methyl ester carboxylesterase